MLARYITVAHFIEISTNGEAARRRKDFKVIFGGKTARTYADATFKLGLPFRR